MVGGPLEDNVKSPGPAGYSAVPLERIKLKPPSWTMSIKPDPLKGLNTPGPAAYLPNMSHKERSPAFTMRIKHSEYTSPVAVNEPEFLLEWDDC